MEKTTEENNKASNPRKKIIRYSKSLIFPYQMKKQKTLEDSQDNNKKPSLTKNTDENLSNKLTTKKDSKHLLIVHKINLKQKKNQFYKTGAKDIFNEEDLFFANKYKGKKVVVGKNKSNNIKPNFIINLYDKKKINNFNKHRYKKATTIKNYSYFKNKNDEASTFKKSYLKNSDLYESNNYSVVSTNTRIDNLRKSLNLFGKRSGIFYPGKNNITDKELNSIYKNFLDREKENRQKEIKKIKLNNKYNNLNEEKEENDDKNNNLNITNKIFTNAFDKEIKSRLNLQEKILHNYQLINKKSKKLINKIKKNTSKISHDILMNQLDDYRIKMEKLDEEQKRKKDSFFNKSLYWLSSLRNYPNNKSEEDDEEKTKNNNLIFPAIHKNERKINKKREEILDNYINNFHYSFGSNSNLYCDIESNISPLYALILSDTFKSNEKISNTHIDDFYKPSLRDSQNGISKLKKNLSAPKIDPKIINKYNLKEKNRAINLNVEGKRLIEYEMEMAKQLEGKRKKLIKTNYNDDETDNKTFAKSYILNNYFFPRAIKNAFDLH